MQQRKLSFMLIGTVLFITCLFPQGLAVPSNPGSPQLLVEYDHYEGIWQPGDKSAYYTTGQPYNKVTYLLSYNSSDYVNSTIFSMHSDYSSPFINATGNRNKWFGAWINEPLLGAYINLTLSNSPSPTYTAFDLTLKSASSAQLQLGGNLDIQTAHRQYSVEGSTIFDASAYVGLVYKVTFTAGHYYTVKLGNKDWEPINMSVAYPYVTLLVFPAPTTDSAKFYDPSSYNPDFISGSLTGFMNIPYFLAATGIHPLTTQDYLVVAVASSSSNKWIPQQLLIQDEENVWEEFLAANPWYYFFPQVNPWLFLLVVGGIAAIIVFVVRHSINKSKLKASTSGGAKGGFLDEL